MIFLASIIRCRQFSNYKIYRMKNNSEKKPTKLSNQYISDYIPKNIPADLNTLIHVTGDFFSFGKGGGEGFLNGRSL